MIFLCTSSRRVATRSRDYIADQSWRSSLIVLVTPQSAQTSTSSLDADVYIKMLGVVWTLLLLVAPSLCFNHWMVTEDGKIEYQVQWLCMRGSGT